MFFLNLRITSPTSPGRDFCAKTTMFFTFSAFFGDSLHRRSKTAGEARHISFIVAQRYTDGPCRLLCSFTGSLSSSVGFPSSFVALQCYPPKAFPGDGVGAGGPGGIRRVALEGHKGGREPNVIAFFVFITFRTRVLKVVLPIGGYMRKG